MSAEFGRRGMIRFAEWRKAVKNDYESYGRTDCARCATAQFRSITLISGAKSWSFCALGHHRSRDNSAVRNGYSRECE